jgi:cell wall-associated NlpC family hydrolase
MAVQDFLNTYKNSMQNSKIINPLTARSTPVATEIKPPNTGFGQQVPDWLQGKASGAVNRYMQNKANTTADLASKYTDMAAGQIPVNEYGIPTNKSSDFSDAFNQRLSTIDNIGQTATDKVEAAARWQQLQNQQELNAGYQVNWAPGASGNNAGAKAVSIAMTAVQNHTPYVWGGNSLTGGVDCSGLVQQVYSQLGINLPRTTYEQAKYGKVVSMGSLLPGDLIFYNTGSNDPNGIGTLSHVAIYIGNGQVIDAPGRGRTVRITSINNSGSPARAVRPW